MSEALPAAWRPVRGTLARDSLGEPARCSSWWSGLRAWVASGPAPGPRSPPTPPSRAGRAGDGRSGNWGCVSASLSSPGRSGVYRAGRAALPLLSPNHFRTRPFGKSPCKKDLIEKGCHCSLPPAQPRGAVERAVPEQGRRAERPWGTARAGVSSDVRLWDSGSRTWERACVEVCCP